MEANRISPQSSNAAQQSPAKTSRHSSASGPSAAQGAGPEGADFLSLLASMDMVGATGAAEGADALLLPSTQDPQVDGGAVAQDASALVAWQGLLDMSQFSKTAMPVADTESSGAAALAGLGKEGSVVAGANGLPGTLAGVEGFSTFGGRVLPSMVSETAAMDLALDEKDAGVAGGPAAGHGRSAGRGVSVLAAGGRGDSTLSIAATTLGKDGLSMGSSAAHRSGPSVAADPAATVSAVRDMQPATERGAVSPQLAQDPVGGLVAALGGAESSGRAGDFSEGADRGGRGDGASSFAGESGADAFDVDSGGADAVSSADGYAGAMGAADEDLLAEQISFWANQKLQSAEVTVQRDGQPVEVTVSLQGNEAHVAFRSDQQQTRDLIDQGAAQLSAMLQEQGLMLSGMSVGTSGQQRSNDPSNSSRGEDSEEGKRGTVLAPVAGTSGSAGRAQGQRVLDVFA